MNTKFELETHGLKELSEKVKLADALLIELQKLITEISETTITITVKQN